MVFVAVRKTLPAACREPPGASAVRAADDARAVAVVNGCNARADARDTAATAEFAATRDPNAETVALAAKREPTAEKPAATPAPSAPPRAPKNPPIAAPSPTARKAPKNERSSGDVFS